MGKTVLPTGFSISEEMRIWAATKVPQIDIDAEHEAFCDYWRARGRMMADWVACWRTWMRNCLRFKGATKEPMRMRTLEEIQAAEAVQYAKH